MTTATTPFQPKRLARHRKQLQAFDTAQQDSVLHSEGTSGWQLSPTYLSEADFQVNLDAAKLHLGLKTITAVAISTIVNYDASTPAMTADMVRHELCQLGGLDDYPTASFYEPLVFEWSKQDHIIREAARQFSEFSDANHSND